MAGLAGRPQGLPHRTTEDRGQKASGVPPRAGSSRDNDARDGSPGHFFTGQTLPLPCHQGQSGRRGKKAATGHPVAPPVPDLFAEGGMRKADHPPGGPLSTPLSAGPGVAGSILLQGTGPAQKETTPKNLPRQHSAGNAPGNRKNRW